MQEDKSPNGILMAFEELRSGACLMDIAVELSPGELKAEAMARYGESSFI